MARPEVDFPSANLEEIRRKLFEHGCVLLRNFADPARLGSLRTTLFDIYAQIDSVHVFEQDMLDRKHSNLSSYIFTERHEELLSKLFCGRPYGINYSTTCARRVSAPNAVEGWQKPLGYHIDAGFHTLAYTVNFWVPFEPCGVQAPSLAVIEASIPEMLTYSQYDGKPENRGAGEWNFHHFNPVIGDAAHDKIEAIREIDHVFERQIWRPIYEVGDAMLISNYTLHGTHATAEMTKSRANMELRFTSEATIFEFVDDCTKTLAT